MELFVCALLLLFIGTSIESTTTQGGGVDKIAELFSEIVNDDVHEDQSDIINNDYNSVMCWMETINSVVYKNGTRNDDRQFSTVFETPGDFNEESLKDEYGETRRSKTLYYNSTYETPHFTVQINKSLTCGVGKIIIKEFKMLTKGKKKMQIDLGSKSMLEDYEFKKCANLTRCKTKKISKDSNVLDKFKGEGPHKIYLDPNPEYNYKFIPNNKNYVGEGHGNIPQHHGIPSQSYIVPPENNNVYTTPPKIPSEDYSNGPSQNYRTPQNSGGIPSQNYRTPQNNENYGIPSLNKGGIPSQTYRTPSLYDKIPLPDYVTPPQNNGGIPSQDYKTPSQTNGGIPSKDYKTPSLNKGEIPSQVYRTPSQSYPNNGKTIPSQNYRIPPQSNNGKPPQAASGGIPAQNYRIPFQGNPSQAYRTPSQNKNGAQIGGTPPQNTKETPPPNYITPSQNNNERPPHRYGANPRKVNPPQNYYIIPIRPNTAHGNSPYSPTNNVSMTPPKYTSPAKNSSTPDLTKQPCKFRHKLNITFQISIDHIITKNNSSAPIKITRLLNAAKSQAFNITQRNLQKINKPNQEEVNKTWERLIRMLSRQYFMDCCNKIVPFSEIPLKKINVGISDEEAMILFDAESRAAMAAVHKQMQKCNG